MEQIKAIGERLVDEGVMADLIDSSVRFLQEDRRTGRIGIPFIRVGRLCKYRPSQVLAHLEARSATKVAA